MKRFEYSRHQSRAPHDTTPGTAHAGVWAARMLLVTFVAAGGLALGAPSTAVGAYGDCGQPITDGPSPLASDALDVLLSSVTANTPCPSRSGALDPCRCDVTGDGRILATDALRVLQVAVGAPGAALECDCAVETTTTTSTSTTTSTTSTTTSTTGTTTTTLFNNPPTITPGGIYRTFTERAIAFPVEAEDEDGDNITFSSPDTPEGCTVDENSGLIEWTPEREQVGVFEIPVKASDDAANPASSTENFLFKIQHPDACTVPTCDPATGCTTELIDAEVDCCEAEPVIRVAEPQVECPEGRIAFVGRNTVGFGRMQNCDLLPLIPFAQAGINVRFHVEARCLDFTRPITIRASLIAGTDVLFAQIYDRTFFEREDGFFQRLSLFYAVDQAFDIFELVGREAVLRVRLTDADGVNVEETIRVTLTQDSVGDLPEPDIQDRPGEEAGCLGCHRPLNDDGERVGIEDPHPAVALTCTACHGGNAFASTRVDAHVSEGDGPKFIKNLTSDELDALDLSYIRFVNPGDLRVARGTCGFIGCHADKVDSLPTSTMSTYGGHYTLPRYLAGASRTPMVAAIDIFDPDFDAVTAPPGAVEALTALRGPHPSADRTEMLTAIDEYLPKSCPTCHLAAFGPNHADGAYRSSGCTACHMVYADNGLSQSDDPRVPKSFPPHPAKHVLTTAIPTEQCAHCHFQGGRIGLAYRGIREGGFAAEKTPENAVSLGVPLYGHDSEYYFSDEDSTNAHDETPPDLHFTAGMVCGDCHIGGDVHGDGNIYSAERYQVGARCEDCHGTVRQALEEDPDDGLFKNSKGDPMRRVRREEDDRIMLDLLMGTGSLEIPQIKRILDAGTNPRMNEAMGVNENDFSHTESLECYACHNTWRQNCFGCHISLDDRGFAKNKTTGESTRGSISVTRDDYTLDFMALGMDRAGKLAPLCSSMSILMSYTDESGVVHYDDMIRTSGDGKKGFGWNPFHHHTTQKIPENCDRCHPVAGGPDNSATLAATYGFGSGEVLVEDGNGTIHDLTQFLDDDGNLISDFPHPDTGPVPADVRERALAVEVVPQPR